MHTAADYQETRIKTYGFETMNDLCLLEISPEKGRFAECASIIEFIGSLEIRFVLVLLQRHEQDKAFVSILLRKKWQTRVEEAFKERSCKENIQDLNIISPVGLIFFYGPHFGDRFGIIDTALKSLEKEDIFSIATGCSGSSIYLVLPDKMTDRAKDVLKDTFEIPRYVKK